MKQSESGEFFVPELTAPGLSIRFSLSLIEDLTFATIEGLKAVPRRGLEIGGILLGRLDAAQGAILAEDYEPIESEHLHGPSWLLSPKDRSAFRRALDGLRERGSQQLRPVGFYRSQTRDGLSFDDQDNAMMREMFASEAALCLLVRPSIAEPGVAQVGMVTEGLLQPVAVFPFHAGVLREGDFQIVEDSSPIIEDSTPIIEDSIPVVEDLSPIVEDSSPVIAPAEPIPQPAPLPFVPKPKPVDDAAPEPEERGRIPRTVTLVAIAAAILLCAFLVARFRTPHVPVSVRPATAAAPPTVAAPPAITQPPPADVPVALNVQRQNGTATLNWNRDAPTVKNADYALLLISDGRHREHLRLSKTDLETGRVVYLPRSREISFQLRLFAQSHSTTESIRSAVDLPAAPPSDSHPKARSLSAAARLPGGDRPELTPASAPPVDRAPESTPAAPSTVSQPPAQTVAPPVVAQPAPPQEAAAEPEAPKPTPFAEPDKTPPKPREAEVVTTVSLELIGHSGIREALDAVSPRRIFGFGSDKTTPPRIVRQILPGINPVLASRIRGTRLIDLKITIGPGGQVIKTEFPDGHAADPIDSAVYYAARQWIFKPARVGSRPVESKVLMHFVLKRSS